MVKMAEMGYNLILVQRNEREVDMMQERFDGQVKFTFEDESSGNL